MGQQTLKGKNQSHLPPSLRVDPDQLGYSPEEQKIIDAQAQGDVGLCQGCEHGLVVSVSGVRGKRVICTLARMELRGVSECNRHKVARGS